MSPEREPSGDGGGAATVNPVGAFSVSAVVVGTTAVLSLAGRVDLSALPACRHAVDELLGTGVNEITVDLQIAHFDDESIALLALMRRYALRHQARLALADIPPHIARVLDRTGVRWLYETGNGTEDTGTGSQLPGKSPTKRPAKRSVSLPSASNGPVTSPRASR